MTALIWTRSLSAVHLLDPSHQWQRVGQSLMDPCVRLSSRSLWKRITSLCAMFEQDTQQTVVFVKSQTKCLFWDRSETCDRLPQTQAHVVQSPCLQGGGLHSPKEELVLYTLIVNLKSLSSFTAFDSLRPTQHALVTPLPNVTALQIRVGNMFKMITASSHQYANKN